MKFGSWLAIPALLIRTSSRPNCWRTCVAASAMDCSSVTPSWIGESWPFIPSPLISDIALFALSRERQAMMVWKFSEVWAITLAVAKPMPELAPVYLLEMVLS